MSSFETIDYSIRPNKNIERKLIFETVISLDPVLGVSHFRYVGMGSLWFSDFLFAHKKLMIKKLICIEHEQVADRVKYNKPYSCIEVIPGESTDVLSTIELGKHKNCIWLDYDTSLEGPVLDDIEIVLNSAEIGSIMFITLNAHKDRLIRGEVDSGDKHEEGLRYYAGKLIPASMPRNWKGSKIYPVFLASLLFSHIEDVIYRCAKNINFLPLLNYYYKDGAPMITIGGIIVDEELNRKFEESEILGKCEYATGVAQENILTPPLTLKEKIALDSLLPSSSAPTVSDVERLGFTLKQSHIDYYCKYYRFYPTFAEAKL